MTKSEQTVKLLKTLFVCSKSENVSFELWSVFLLLGFVIASFFPTDLSLSLLVSSPHMSGMLIVSYYVLSLW